MRHEVIDRRVLGAVRFIDVNTALHIPGPFDVQAQGVVFVRNRRDLYVIRRASGFREYGAAFEAPPETPPVQSVAITVTVTDPARRYLPRQSIIQLPRDADPANAEQVASLFHPIDILLFPTNTITPMPGWAVIRALVVDAADAAPPLPGALIRVLRTSDAALLARGLSEWRGRLVGAAMVTVPGLPVTTWGNGNANSEPAPVLVHEVPVTLEVIYDPAFDPSDGAMPNPDDLEARRNELASEQFNMPLASGRTLSTTLPVPTPADGDA